MKLVEKLIMTRRWATDSRHITHRGGMYWSNSSIQATCSSGGGRKTYYPVSSELNLTYESDNKDSKKDPQGVAEDVRQHNRGEGHLNVLLGFGIFGIRPSTPLCMNTTGGGSLKPFWRIYCLHSLEMESTGTSLA